MSEQKTITHKCANRSCNEMVTVKNPEFVCICGIPLSVCKNCEQVVILVSLGWEMGEFLFI
jgi:hypothetical protein